MFSLFDAIRTQVPAPSRKDIIHHAAYLGNIEQLTSLLEDQMAPPMDIPPLLAGKLGNMFGNQMPRRMVDKSRRTPLHYAALKGHVDVVRLLLEGSTSDYREMVDKSGKTALHYAIESNNLEVAKQLLEGSRIKLLEIADSRGRIPLHTACKCSNLEILKVVLDISPMEHRCIPTHDEIGNTPFHLSVSNSEALRMLVKDSPPEYLECQDDYGRTPVHKVLSGPTPIISHDDFLMLLRHSRDQLSTISAQVDHTILDTAIINKCSAPFIHSLLIDRCRVLIGDEACKVLFTMIQRILDDDDEEQQQQDDEGPYDLWCIESVVKSAVGWIVDPSVLLEQHNDYLSSHPHIIQGLKSDIIISQVD